MHTLRQELTDEGFNWAKGVVLYQEVLPYDWCNGSPNYRPVIYAGESHEVNPTRRLASDDPLLDSDLDAEQWQGNIPRFVACDGERIYFPVQYDSSTWIETLRCKAPVNALDSYIGTKDLLPYPGG